MAAMSETSVPSRGASHYAKGTAANMARSMVVIAAIERQHGKIGGLPEQVWSLRVTLVFRHEDSGWRLAHRHADPLVHEIGLEQAAGIARGKQVSHTVKEPGGSECKCIQGIPP